MIIRRALSLSSFLLASLALVALSFAQTERPDKPKTLKVVPTSGPLAGKEIYGSSYALIIGLNEYAHLPKSKWLSCAVKDATEMRDVLVKHYGFPAANVALLLDKDATLANIKLNLAAMTDKKRFEPNARILIYFSGHGQTVKLASGGDLGFLIPYDARVDLDDPDNPAPYLVSCLSMEEVWRNLDASLSKHVLLIADACYSGLLARPRGGQKINDATLAALAERRARQVMTAGGKGQETFEITKYGHGAFTYKLLEELTARAATPGEAFTTTGLYAAIQLPVADLTQGKQTPQLASHDTEGEFLFITTEPQEVKTEPAAATPSLVTQPAKPAKADQPMTPARPGQVRINPRDDAEMVWIPGGDFIMGEGGDAHKQYVNGFWMYTKEVTNAQFRKFVRANPQWSIQRIDRRFHDGSYLNHWKRNIPQASSANDYPVVHVSWYVAKAYAEWTGGRLPTEAEWEYAAKSGKNFEYGTSTGQLAKDLANYDSNGTEPVGRYPPNPFGVYDMAGNVWEWCSSLFKPYPYRANDGRENLNATGDPVRRGGSCCGHGGYCRAANRFRGLVYDGPTASHWAIGFRVVVGAGVQ